LYNVLIFPSFQIINWTGKSDWTRRLDRSIFVSGVILFSYRVILRIKVSKGKIKRCRIIILSHLKFKFVPKKNHIIINKGFCSFRK